MSVRTHITTKEQVHIVTVKQADFERELIDTGLIDDPEDLRDVPYAIVIEDPGNMEAWVVYSKTPFLWGGSVES